MFMQKYVKMKRLIVFASIISCFSVMLLSCASIITHKDTIEQTTPPTVMTTPSTTVVTTVVTTPSWITQTGNHVVNSHSGYVMSYIYEKTLTDKSGNSIISFKILRPEVRFYDNDGLESTVNTNLWYVFNEMEDKVSVICNRYMDADTSSYLSTPDVFIDYTLECFTQEAMSLRFRITETDNNANVYQSVVCYNFDLTTGSIINPTSVFKQKDLSGISKLISEKLTAEGYTLYNDADKLIEQHFNDSWFIKPNTLSLTFSPGKIAAISEGFVEISIEVQQIKDLLSNYGTALFTVSYENN